MRTPTPGQRASGALAETLDRRAQVVVERAAVRAGAAARQRREDYSAELMEHLRSLVVAARMQSTPLFVDYVQWQQRLWRARDVEPGRLETQLRALLCAIDEVLPETASRFEGLIQTALQLLRLPALPEPPSLRADGLAARYLERLLVYDREGALRLVEDALHGGVAVMDIYREIVECAQHELGRLWAQDRISVGQEHYCTAVTQLAVARMYPRLLHESRGPRLVAVCPEGELHELGARMVSDFFELDGWDTTYLGANLPAAGVVQVLAERRPLLLCISVTMSFHLPEVEELIGAVRRDPELSAIKVLVGGIRSRSPRICGAASTPTPRPAARSTPWRADASCSGFPAPVSLVLERRPWCGPRKRGTLRP